MKEHIIPAALVILTAWVVWKKWLGPLLLKTTSATGIRLFSGLVTTATAPWKGVIVVALIAATLILIRLFGSGEEWDLRAFGPFLFFPTVMAWFTTVFGDLPEDRTMRAAQRTALATLLLVVLWHFKIEVAWLIATLGLSLGQHTDNETVVTVAQYVLLATGLVVAYQGFLVGKVYKCTMVTSVLLVLWFMVTT